MTPPAFFGVRSEYMKVFLLYLIVGLCIVVVQTTILNLPLFHGIFFDLLISLVVFLSLKFPDRRGIFVVVIVGLTMDLLSGGIFGLYLTVYFWIFVSTTSLAKYLDVDKAIFQSVWIGVCVFGQNLVFCASLSPSLKWSQLLAVQSPPVLLQTIFAALIGPRILMLLGRLQKRLSVAQRDTEDFAIR